MNITRIEGKNQIELEVEINKYDFDKLSEVLSKYGSILPTNKKIDALELIDIIGNHIDWNSPSQIKDIEFIMYAVGDQFVGKIYHRCNA